MKKRDWYVEHRQQWIMEMLDIYGFINRSHVMKKFGISSPQAAVDFRDLQDRYPDAMIYNESSKRYEKIATNSEGDAAHTRLRQRRVSRRARRPAQ